MSTRIKFLIPFLMLSLSAKEPLHVMSLPKSGTHLTQKYFLIVSRLTGMKRYRYTTSHLSPTHKGLPKNYYETHPGVKKVIVIRDLRDLFLSSLDHIERNRHYLMGRVSLDEEWSLLTRKEKLLQLVDYREGATQNFRWSYHGKNLPTKLHELVQRAIKYSKLPNAHVVRFENLSGNLSKQAQRIECEELNAFLDIKLTEKQYEFIHKNLYGKKLINLGSFVKARHREWEELFDDELRDVFKELYGKELIKLGYEKDLSW